MCRGLSAIKKAMSHYASNFDPSVVAPADLALIVEAAGAIEKMAATIASLAAARMAHFGHKATALRLATETLAKASGTSFERARRDIEVAGTLANQVDVATAARGGELSREQLGLVTRAAELNPDATSRLLQAARTGSVTELAEEARRARSAVEDMEAARRRVHAGREVRTWTDQEGAWHLGARGLPEHGAIITNWLRHHADDVFEEARKEGRHERPEAYLFDALVRLASRGATASGGGAAPKARYEVMFRVDYTAMLRGHAIDGEVSEVAGFGTVTPKVIYDIMDSGDPALKFIITKGKDVVGVAHYGRRPNAYQKSALDWVHPTCAAEGCGIRADFLQSDHRLDWSKSHITLFDLLDRLCRFHHRLKTNQGWLLVPGRGKRAFVAPGDPRHPGPPKVNPAGGATSDAVPP
ncbi:MAG TPA: hypothetical protein VL984_14115 [Acidimicrobiales bacterium]|nr:hypothetical protein [Acidimicrobiales bacterium]